MSSKDARKDKSKGNTDKQRKSSRHGDSRRLNVEMDGKHANTEVKSKDKHATGDRRHKSEKMEESQSKQDHVDGRNKTRYRLDKEEAKPSRNRKDESSNEVRHRDKKDSSDTRGQHRKSLSSGTTGDKLEKRPKEATNEWKTFLEQEEEDKVNEKRRMRHEERRRLRELEEREEQAVRREDAERELRRQQRRLDKQRQEKEEAVAMEAQQQRVEIKTFEESAQGEYADDFEAYDDDFEVEPSGNDNVSAQEMSTSDGSRMSSPLSPSKVTSVPAPLPTRKIASVPLSDQSERRVFPTTVQASFINFRFAQKKQCRDAVANKMLTRAFDLAPLIELERIDYEVFELNPVQEHAQYMRLFGRSGCQHDGTQTGDDRMTREVQTERVETRAIWTQQPPVDDDYSVEVTSNSLPKFTVASNDQLQKDGVVLEQLLGLVDRLIDEDAGPNVGKLTEEDSGRQLSAGHNKYSLFDGSRCAKGRFASGNSGMFCTVHQMEDRDAPLIAVWRVANSTPIMRLLCPTISNSPWTVNCLSFSPDSKAIHVLCGTDVGSLLLWDLQESQCAGGLLPPAYVASGSDSHVYPIVALQVVPMESSIGSYQLLSMDSSSRLCVWVVSGLTNIGQWVAASGSLADLNLKPGSRYRMSRVSSVSMWPPGVSSVTSCVIDTSSSSSGSRLIVGTMDGRIVQCARSSHHRRAHPRSRILGSDHYRLPFHGATVTQLDFHPLLDEPYVLAGYDDGMLRVLSATTGDCVVSFSYASHVPVVQCAWSRSHPAVLFSLDSDGNLCVWHMLRDVIKPIMVQKMPGYVGFDISCDYQWQTRTKNTVVNKARLLLWAIDDKIEVHELSTSLCNPDLDDGFKTSSFFQSLV